MCWFPVYRGGQPSPISGDEYIQEGDLAIVLGLHGKLSAWALLVEVFVEPFQWCRTMWPNDKCVVNMGWNGAEMMAFSSICSMNKLAMLGEKGDPIAAPSVCS